MKKHSCILIFLIFMPVLAHSGWTYPYSERGRPDVYIGLSNIDSNSIVAMIEGSQWINTRQNLNGLWLNSAGSDGGKDALMPLVEGMRTRRGCLILGIEDHDPVALRKINVTAWLNAFDDAGIDMQYLGANIVCDYDPDQGWTPGDIEAAKEWLATKDVDTAWTSSRLNHYLTNPPAQSWIDVIQNADGATYEIAPYRFITENHYDAYSNCLRYNRALGKKVLWLMPRGKEGAATDYLPSVKSVYNWMKSNDLLPDAFVIIDYGDLADPLPKLPERNGDGTYPSTLTGSANWLLNEIANMESSVITTVTDNLVWTDGTVWNNGLPPLAGSDYIVLDGFGIRTPGGTSPVTFEGDSLQVNSGGRIIWKGSGLMTIGDLRLAGGQLTHSAVGGDQIGRLGGAINVLSNSFINAPMSSSSTADKIADPRQLEIQSSMSGDGGIVVTTTKGNAAFLHRGYVIYSTIAKDYAGDTVIEGKDDSGGGGLSDMGATLRLELGNALPHGPGRGNVEIKANGILNLNGFDTAINGLSGAGWVANINGTGQTKSIAPAGADAAAATLTLGNADATAIFDGQILDNLSLVKTGSGTQTLNGANTFSGTATILGGTLAIGADGSIPSSSVIMVDAGAIFDVSSVGSYELASGQTLAGAGSVIGPVTVSAGAMISPGASIGTLGFDSALTLADGSEAWMELNAQTMTCDLLQGITDMNYDGTLVVSNLAGTLAAGQSYHLFSAQSANGDFSEITPATPGPGLVWQFDPAGGTLSVLAIQPPEFAELSLSGQTVSMNGTGPDGYPYTILMSTNLLLPNEGWTIVTSGVFVDGEFNFTDDVVTNSNHVFYKVKTP